LDSPALGLSSDFLEGVLLHMFLFLQHCDLHSIFAFEQAGFSLAGSAAKTETAAKAVRLKQTMIFFIAN
jgi:hypothetical protein